MARVLLTSTITVDMISNPQMVATIVEQAIDLGFAVTGAGADSHRQGYYRVELDAGEDVFAKEIVNRLQTLMALSNTTQD